VNQEEYRDGLIYRYQNDNFFNRVVELMTGQLLAQDLEEEYVEAICDMIKITFKEGKEQGL